MAESDLQDKINKLKAAPTQEDTPPTMYVKVYAPYRVYFDGEAQTVSAANETGPFDILPEHHNFMTLLTPGDMVIQTAHGQEVIPITRGIMHVKADRVIVFLDV